MDISTISNETMNITCLEDVEKRNVLKENEELRQQLHLLKLQLERNQNIKHELEVELELIEANNKNVVKKYEEKIQEIEFTYTERISKLQAVQDEDREQAIAQYSDLERRYQELCITGGSKVVENNCVVHEDIIRNYKNVVENLKQDTQSLKEKICKLECTQLQMSEKNKDLEKQLEDLNETNKCKSDTLKATLIALEEMKDEKALLANELAVLKAGPIEDRGRGNSLFSEIEDKRAVLQKKLSQLHTKYLDLKKILIAKNNELEVLKGESLKFQLRWEEDERNVTARENKFIKSLKERIETLEHRINELETTRPENPKIITISEKDSSNLHWINTIVETARAEAREMRRALDEKSRAYLVRDEDLYELSFDVKSLRRQVAKQQAIITDLESKLSSVENTTSIVEEKPEPLEMSKKSLRFADNVKENDGVPLKKEPKKNEINYPVLLVDTSNKIINKTDKP